MSQMTREEFLKKYGKELVSFSNYYKYTFTFSGVTADGTHIIVCTGGNADDIYRSEVNANQYCTVESLYPFEGSAHRDVERVAHFYEY